MIKRYIKCRKISQKSPQEVKHVVKGENWCSVKYIGKYFHNSSKVVSDNFFPIIFTAKFLFIDEFIISRLIFYSLQIGFLLYDLFSAYNQINFLYYRNACKCTYYRNAVSGGNKSQRDRQKEQSQSRYFVQYAMYGD